LLIFISIICYSSSFFHRIFLLTINDLSVVISVAFYKKNGSGYLTGSPSNSHCLLHCYESHNPKPNPNPKHNPNPKPNHNPKPNPILTANLTLGLLPLRYLLTLTGCPSNRHYLKKLLTLHALIKVFLK
jgi:hypothetical protein